MKITVKIEDIELIVDRPGFTESTSTDAKWRVLRLEDTIIPTIEQLVEKAHELYKLKS